MANTGKRATRYSGDDYNLQIAKIPIESGRGPDTFLEIVQQNDDFLYSAGLDGEGVFSEDKNNYTLMTLTLLQTSAGNSKLWALHNASKLAGGILYPVEGEDTGGTSKIISEAAMIMKMPDETFAKEAGTTVWIIGVHDPDRVIGAH